MLPDRRTDQVYRDLVGISLATGKRNKTTNAILFGPKGRHKLSLRAMKTRREFFKSAALLGALGADALPVSSENTAFEGTSGAADRVYWISLAEKLARPVLANLARRELKLRMPVEERPGSNRRPFTHLEAFGRLLCGVSPWLALENAPPEERRVQQEFINLAQISLDAATSPQSPDFMNFRQGSQPLVDTAFLAQGILRAPKCLWHGLEARVQGQIVDAFRSSREIATPRTNNWVMFAAMVEAALLEFGQATLEERLETCLRKMVLWYYGDGAYGDGEFFRFDYYNSFVIHPMLLDVLSVLKKHDTRFAPAYDAELLRAQRFAEVQERLIAPDGTFPGLGRSVAYRFGAFQTLAQVAWLERLPAALRPAQVRCALSAVMRKMAQAPGTFDANGWLQIGFCGHQPALGEGYISTGSLYLCSAGLLPLGLPVTAGFWSAPAERWTSQRLWSGENVAADHALNDARQVDVPVLNGRAR